MGQVGLELVNLCFADDLFLFAYGNANSARVIMESLEEFKLVSGLIPSLPKSTAYFCNVTNHVKMSILQILPFEEGRLPVKYLGVPLVSSRLIYKDCKELIEKVQHHVDDWKNKSLSIAGRLQLVSSVISSLHVFWASVCMLPTLILLDIEQIMRGFLWCQGKMRSGKAKVAWEVVCLPKDEGGLGIRRLESFNKALMTTHIWKLLSRKINMAECFVKYPTLCSIPTPNLTPDSCDRIKWRNVDGLIKVFSAHEVWSSIRSRGVKVDWCDVVWFSSSIPRHAFHLWLVIHRHLKTQDNLRPWDAAGLNTMVCTLCETQPDSHAHLFFECVFSQQVWHHLKGLASIPNSSDSIDVIINDIKPFATRRTSRSLIAKLVVAETTYFIWQERNRRLFKNSK
nr:reverse transcriptase domain, reverse transcriptase zinc-binding domain protein [Tanacetum cinerariifolium]